jgi:hypothetical protein
MDLGNLTSKLESSPVFVLLAVPLVSLVLWNCWSYIRSPIGDYPGPFLASKNSAKILPPVQSKKKSPLYSTNADILLRVTGWTNLWRLYHISRGNFHHVLEKLHHDYGPVVRIGPNVLDVDSPAVVKTVFNLQNEWRKVRSVFYHLTHHESTQADFVGPLDGVLPWK